MVTKRKDRNFSEWEFHSAPGRAFMLELPKMYYWRQANV